VMLVLLIIFMVITPMLQHGKDVNMAQVDNPTPMQDADKDDALLLAVTHDGLVYFGTDKIELDQITFKVKERLESKSDNKMVFVKADARARYKSVVDVVDSVRAAGVEVALLMAVIDAGRDILRDMAERVRLTFGSAALGADQRALGDRAMGPFRLLGRCLFLGRNRAGFGVCFQLLSDHLGVAGEPYYEIAGERCVLGKRRRLHHKLYVACSGRALILMQRAIFSPKGGYFFRHESVLSCCRLS